MEVDKLISLSRVEKEIIGMVNFGNVDRHQSSDKYCLSNFIQSGMPTDSSFAEHERPTIS